MKEEVKERRTPYATVNPELNKYSNVILFPEKLKEANEMLKKFGMPKQYYDELGIEMPEKYRMIQGIDAI